MHATSDTIGIPACCKNQSMRELTAPEYGERIFTNKWLNDIWYRSNILTVAINLDAAETTGSILSDRHFGVVATFHRMRLLEDGTVWDTMDEIVDMLDYPAIRYPGGAATELYFDITNPNATSVTSPAGNSLNLIAQTKFLLFCAEHNIKPVMVVPMFPGLDGSSYGNRHVKAGWESDLAAYITATLVEARGDIDAFELGNEFPAHMIGREYGDVASASAKVIQAAIDAYRIDHNMGPDWDEPEIIVQIFGQSPGGGHDDASLTSINANLIAEFDAVELAAIDGVAGHFYFGVQADNNPTYDEISALAPPMWGLMEAWDVASGHKLDRYITEWNVQHRYSDFTGLRQAAPVLEMLSTFAKNGVDLMTFWAMQYNNMTLATPDAENTVRLTVIGEFFNLMHEKLVGTQVVDLQSDLDGADIHAFANADTAYLFVSSLQEGQQTFDINFGGDTGSVVSSNLIGVTGGDGKYRETAADGLTGLMVFEEPDAIFVNTLGTYAFGNEFDLDAYEILVIQLDLSRDGTSGNDTLTGTVFDDRLFGAAGDDVLSSGLGADVLDGGAGNDTASYQTATASVSAYLNLGLAIGDDGNDSLVSIENLIGSDYNDRLIGDAGTNTLSGGTGDDIIKTKGGNDTAYGGAGNDRITGDVGNDVLYGGDGADIIIALAGLDEIYGDAGNDRLYGGQDSDSIIGGAGNDKLLGNRGNDSLNGGAGVDDLRGGGGNDGLDGGANNDYLFGGNGTDIIYGGAGNDVLSGGSGEGIADGFADIFVFRNTATEGYDRIKDFEDGIDRIDLTDFGYSDFADVSALATQVAAGVKINFGDGNVLLLEGMGIADFDSSDVILQ